MLDMHIRPSELMDIDDAYTAFCFDEACAFIISQLKDGKEPVIKKGREEGGPQHLSRPSDLYKKYQNS